MEKRVRREDWTMVPARALRVAPEATISFQEPRIIQNGSEDFRNLVVKAGNTISEDSIDGDPKVHFHDRILPRKDDARSRFCLDAEAHFVVNGELKNCDTWSPQGHKCAAQYS